LLLFLRPSAAAASTTARCCVIILGVIFWSSCRIVFRIGSIRRLLPPSVLVHVMSVSKIRGLNWSASFRWVEVSFLFFSLDFQLDCWQDDFRRSFQPFCRSNFDFWCFKT
jgi:hypothetical protein